jgi:hypothetical protein
MFSNVVDLEIVSICIQELKNCLPATALGRSVFIKLQF